MQRVVAKHVDCRYCEGRKQNPVFSGLTCDGEDITGQERKADKPVLIQHGQPFGVHGVCPAIRRTVAPAEDETNQRLFLYRPDGCHPDIPPSVRQGSVELCKGVVVDGIED